MQRDSLKVHCIYFRCCAVEGFYVILISYTDARLALARADRLFISKNENLVTIYYSSLEFCQLNVTVDHKGYLI